MKLTFRRTIIDNFVFIVFALSSFYAGYSNSIVFSLIALITVGYLIIFKKHLMLGILLGIAALDNFFILNIFGFRFTLNSLLIIAYIVFNLKSIKILTNKKSITFMLTLLILLIIPLVSIYKSQYNLVFSWYMNIILIFLMNFSSFSKDYYFQTRKAFSTLSFVWVLLIFYYIVTNPVTLADFSIRATIVANLNYNSLAVGVVVFGTTSLYNYLFEFNYKFRFFFLISYFLSIIIVFLTGSRNSLLALAIVSIIMFFMYLRVQSKSIRKLAVFPIAILLSIPIYNTLAELSIFERFSIDTLIEDGGSGRVEAIIAIVTKILPENLFFGVGIGGQEGALTNLGFKSFYAAHNIILSALTDLGLFGFIPFVFLNIKALINQRITEQINLKGLFFLIFIVLLCLGIGETIYMERIFWLSLGILLSLKNK